MDGPPLRILGLLIVLAAAGGITALSAQCELGNCASTPAAYHLDPSGPHGAGFTYALQLQDGAMQQEAVAWTDTPLPLAAAAVPAGPNVTFHLVVTKDGVPLNLDHGTTFVLPGGTGVVAWSNQGTGSSANPGSVFDLRLYRGSSLVHDAQVVIDGSKG